MLFPMNSRKKGDLSSLNNVVVTRTHEAEATSAQPSVNGLMTHRPETPEFDRQETRGIFHRILGRRTG